MAKRKTSKDYRKEHSDLTAKVEALEARIKKRCVDMCNKFPDADVGTDEGIVTAKDFLDILQHVDVDTETHLHVMSKIEEDNERKSNIKQTEIIFN